MQQSLRWPANSPLDSTNSNLIADADDLLRPGNKSYLQERDGALQSKPEGADDEPEANNIDLGQRYRHQPRLSSRPEGCPW
ncbi:hypothetical protein PM082_013292 [Marasmius tenuissimus]|nr:hypothetical protein PM082_013292 [Marasmius tenuissimus]